MSNEYEQKQQLLLDAIAKSLCGVNRQGTVIFCNEALLTLSGFSREEIIGKNAHDVLHPSHADGRVRSREECALHKAIVRGEPVQLVANLVRKDDGSSMPVEYWGRPLQQPVSGAWYVVTIKDLSEIEMAREALRRSEEKYRRILVNMPDVAWTSDVNGRTHYVSPKVKVLLGFTNKEIYGAGGTGFRLSQIHPEDFGRVSQSYRALFEQQVPFDEEYRIRHKDGSWIWVHDRATTTHIDEGILCADGFLSDITRRKQAEAELRSKTAFLQAQTNATLDGLLVVDDSGRKLLANERFLELLEMPSELIEDTDNQMLAYAVTRMKDGDSFLTKVKHLYRHPTETSRDEIELKNGRILDRYSAPVVDKDGTYYGRIWNFRDITEQKRNQDTLQQLSLAVEQSPSSVVITDPQGNISYVNRKFTECTGYTLQEVLGKNPRILNAGKCPAELYRDLWSTITQGREWRGELCNKKKNGEIFWESATITAMTNPNGQITHFLAVKEDITEKRSLESQLRHAQKMEGIGQLAAGIAHEINTPTQFVMDNLTFLRDSMKSVNELLGQYRTALQGLAGSLTAETILRLKEAEQAIDLEFVREEVPRAIDQSLEGAKRVAKIVRAMKEFSHPDSAEKTATDLNRTIESTITVARNEWKYVSDVTTEFEPQLPAVVCYSGDINQVVLNLIVNAAHAIKEKVKEGEKGRITVRTKSLEGYAEISVSDSGTGIPEAIRHRVFDPFFTTKEVGKGTGQGLALAYTVVVKKHGGKIWFETEMGEGTTFFIRLPLSAAISAKGGA